VGDVIIRTDGATFSESPSTGQNPTSAVNDLWPKLTENFVAGALQGFTGRGRNWTDTGSNDDAANSECRNDHFAFY
jgi:hypothetical protein